MGTAGQPQGRRWPRGSVWWLRDLLLPGLSQAGSRSPSPSSIGQTQRSGISRVQSGHLRPRLAWVLSSLEEGLQG